VTISLYTFEGTTNLADIAGLIQEQNTAVGADKAAIARRYPVPAIRVHAGTGCGMGFKDVAAILEPTSENPCLLLYNPLGINGVQAILDSFKRSQTVKQTPKQTFEVGMQKSYVRKAGDGHLTVEGTMYVEADSQEQAEAIVDTLLQHGLSTIDPRIEWQDDVDLDGWEYEDFTFGRR
jgi:hypothetical protein